ncbi:aldose 1-epimerase [Enterococcus faecalis 13-SD-W-01]|nr:aldose 1-epimerase [Enterococcus faecalis 13-SD-W-01]
MKIEKQDFGGGCHLLTIENDNKTTLAVSDFGARIVRLTVLIDGEPRELILGFDQAEEYQEKDPYIGASIGRVAGRIKEGRFVINGKSCQADTDPKTGHTLHGNNGFDTKKWAYTTVIGKNEASVIFSLTSLDQENGFPGNLDAEVRYTLTNDDVWRVTTRGISDQDTLFNPTNHVYFNLSGNVDEPIDEHTLQVNSDLFAKLKEDMIPTGEICAVEQTPFDFQEPKKLKTVFKSEFQQSQMVDGIDHPFFLKNNGHFLPVATLTSPDEKAAIEVSTNASCAVIFTANFGENGPKMKRKKLVNHGGITFETQEAPGSEQFGSFGNIFLPAGHVREWVTEFKILSK